MIFGVVEKVLGIVDKFIPDPEQKYKAQIEIQELLDRGNARQHELMKGQLEINATEAKSSSVFVAGWRPFIGWGCGFAFLYATMGEPFLRFVVALMKIAVTIPAYDTALLEYVLYALLGMATLRTGETITGTKTTTLTKPAAVADTAKEAIKKVKKWRVGPRT